MRAVAAVVTVVLLGGCVPASPDPDAYRDKTALTLASAASEVRTVARLMETSYDSRMLRPTAKAQLRHSEDALDTATSAFTEVNPPPSQDRLNRRTSTLLGDAGDLVAEARIALERARTGRYPALVEDLESLATRLERLEGRLA